MTAKIRTLLVEDNPGDAEIVAHYAAQLDEPRLELKHVERLSDARRVLEDEVFDVLILDLNLPDASGVEGVELLSTAHPELALVVLTGDDFAEGLPSMRAGAQDHLLKSELSSYSLSKSVTFAVERAAFQNRAARLERQLMENQRYTTLGKIAAGVAHGVNNPLAYMQTSLELLRLTLEKQAPVSPGAPNRSSSVDALGLIEQCEQGVKTIAEIVRDLSAFPAHASDRKLEHTDVNQVVRHACTIVARQSDSHVAVELELADGLPALRVDASRLGLALVNLLLDATETLPGEASRKQVQVASKKYSRSEVAIDITDMGRSYSEPEVRQIFDPYFAVNLRNLESHLALTLAHDAVAFHGGSILVESVEGGGAKLRVLLPIDGNSHSAAELG